MQMVLLVDHHVAFRQALAFLLKQEPDIRVVTEVGSLHDAADGLEDVKLAVVDLDTVKGDVTRLAWFSDSKRKVVALSSFGNRTPDLARLADVSQIAVVPSAASLDDLMTICRTAMRSVQRIV